MLLEQILQFHSAQKAVRSLAAESLCDTNCGRISGDDWDLRLESTPRSQLMLLQMCAEGSGLYLLLALSSVQLLSKTGLLDCPQPLINRSSKQIFVWSILGWSRALSYLFWKLNMNQSAEGKIKRKRKEGE